MLLSGEPGGDNVVPFPREGFLIGNQHCRCPGPESYLMCFLPAGHDGPHGWADWRGCRVWVPGLQRTVPFKGFAS